MIFHPGNSLNLIQLKNIIRKYSTYGIQAWHPSATSWSTLFNLYENCNIKAFIDINNSVYVGFLSSNLTMCALCSTSVCLSSV